MGQIDVNAIPCTGTVKETKIESIELKNVLCRPSGSRNINVQVVPFDERNDEHVDFAYSYSDMLLRAPSAFKTVSDAARAYVRLFMVHTEADEKREDSDYSLVLNDLRAARTLFNQDEVQTAFQRFFENA